jgi:hypothetical protein
VQGCVASDRYFQQISLLFCPIQNIGKFLEKMYFRKKLKNVNTQIHTGKAHLLKISQYVFGIKPSPFAPTVWAQSNIYHIQQRLSIIFHFPDSFFSSFFVLQ